MATARREALHAGPDHVLQLRVRVRTPGLRRPRHAAGTQVRGQSRAPGLTGSQLRQGAGHAEPDHRSRPHSSSAQAGRGPGRREVGARVVGRRTRRHRGAHPQGPGGRPAQRGDVPRRPPGRGRLHRTHARGLGRRRAQLAHERLFERRALRVPLVDGNGPPEPGPRERKGHRARQQPSRDRPLLQPPRAADHGGEEERRQTDRPGHAPVEHRDPRGPLVVALSGLGSGDLPGGRELDDPGRPVRPRVRAPVVELAGLPGRQRRSRRAVRALRGAAARNVRGVHLRVRRERIGD